MSKKYRIDLTLGYSTDGEPDGGASVFDQTDDPAISLIKQRVFKKHLLVALDKIDEELVGMGLETFKKVK